jgi:hypothetical protein
MTEIQVDPSIDYFDDDGNPGTVAASQVRYFLYDPNDAEESRRLSGLLLLKTQPQIWVSNPDEVARQIESLRARGLLPAYIY